MDIPQLIALITSLASAVAAILAWIAKIQWSDEYSKAKDETIKAKDTLIQVKDAQLQTLITNKDEIIKAKEEQIRVLEREVKSLNELTPMKIREYFLSVREQMEEYNTVLKTQLDEAQKEISLRKNEIAELVYKGEKSAGEIEKLEKERQLEEWQRKQDIWKQKQEKWIRSMDAIDSAFKSQSPFLREEAEELINAIVSELRWLAQSADESNTLGGKPDIKSDSQKNSSEKLDTLTETLFNLLKRRKPNE